MTRPGTPRPASARRPRPARRPESSGAADADLLACVAYFARLPSRRLRELAEHCRARTLGPGETLFEEGAPCAGLFVVAAGRIEVHQVSWRGREQVFHTEGPGATLGEGPLFDRGGYIASAVAVEPSRVLLVPRPAVLALCRSHPDVALAMLESLARRLRRFADIVADLAFRPVNERLARYLAAAAAAAPTGREPVVDLRLTQAQLAARLGTVRELVARALGELERAGTIARHGKRLVIRDRARLEALALGLGQDDVGGRHAVGGASRATDGGRGERGPSVE